MSAQTIGKPLIRLRSAFTSLIAHIVSTGTIVNTMRGHNKVTIETQVVGLSGRLKRRLKKTPTKIHRAKIHAELGKTGLPKKFIDELIDVMWTDYVQDIKEEKDS